MSKEQRNQVFQLAQQEVDRRFDAMRGAIQLIVDKDKAAQALQKLTEAQSTSGRKFVPVVRRGR